MLSIRRKGKKGLYIEFQEYYYFHPFGHLTLFNCTDIHNIIKGKNRGICEMRLSNNNILCSAKK